MVCGNGNCGQGGTQFACELCATLIPVVVLSLDYEASELEPATVQLMSIKAIQSHRIHSETEPHQRRDSTPASPPFSGNLALLYPILATSFSSSMTLVSPSVDAALAAPLQQPLLSAASSTTSASSAASSSTTPSPLPSTPSHRTFRFAHPLVYFLVLFGMSSLSLAAFHPQPLPPPLSLLRPVVELAYILFREQCVVQAVFYTAVGLHVGEAVWVAVSGVLRRKGVVDGWERLAWVGQTVLLGWGSVGLLRRLPDVQLSNSRSAAAVDR